LPAATGATGAALGGPWRLVNRGWQGHRQGPTDRAALPWRPAGGAV